MKKIWIPIGIVVWLVGCYVIGQTLHKNDVAQVQPQGEETQTEASGIEEVTFDNVRDTEDNPWGYTAGKIILEDETEAIFLTPGTSVFFDGSIPEEGLKLGVSVHPWVADSSDGLGIMIDYYNGDNRLNNTDYFVESKGELGITLNKADYPDVTRIVITCNAGKNGNDDCDWAVIKLN